VQGQNLGLGVTPPPPPLQPVLALVVGRVDRKSIDEHE